MLFPEPAGSVSGPLFRAGNAALDVMYEGSLGLGASPASLEHPFRALGLPFLAVTYLLGAVGL